MKLAVVVIDMLNDFVTGKFGFEGARRIIPNIKRLVEFARSKGIRVIYACDAHGPKDPELGIWGPHALKGTKGAQVIPELEPRRDVVIEKRAYSAFFNTKLDKILRGFGISNLVLTGVITEICVLHTAADAFYRGYKLMIPRDCVASPDQKAHSLALDHMRRIYGAKIITLKELIKR